MQFLMDAVMLRASQATALSADRPVEKPFSNDKEKEHDHEIQRDDRWKPRRGDLAAR